MKGEMSDIFVGVFEILQKERKESKKGKKQNKEIEWFVVSQL